MTDEEEMDTLTECLNDAERVLRRSNVTDYEARDVVQLSVYLFHARKKQSQFDRLIDSLPGFTDDYKDNQNDDDEDRFRIK